ncbi:hypothetical protein M9H77_17472 [Catharanthus roseus]|uniref:Uncharacterized protein n=1 Tax=Catharanthus roseus TaxID=4058 RepID=A0ACC0B4P9_CATRO|nr:hypothetical protein M9H77_17472 [Catharanthus roseus]
MPNQKPVDSRVLLNWRAPWRFRQDHRTPYIKLLKTSAGTRNLKLGKIIHAHLLSSDQLSAYNVIGNNTLLNLYVKCDQLSVAQEVFDGMRLRNIVSWSILMSGYLHKGFCPKVLDLFRSMISTVDGQRPNELLVPNKYVLSTVLSCCADNGLLFEGQQCHGYALKSGLVFHRYVKNALLSMYSMCSEVYGAMTVFIEVPGSDIYTYNSILNGLVENGFLGEALNVLRRMVDEHMDWDIVSFLGALGLCARLKNLKMGLQVHARILKVNFVSDQYINSAVTDMYGKCGKISAARKMFDKLEIRNVVSWTSIMAAYSQNECYEQTLKLFLEMDLVGIRPNEYTYAVLLHSSASLTASGFGSSLHAHIDKIGYKGYVVVGNALINMYSRNGNIEAATKIFVMMRFRDSITWNSMISGYSHHGLGKEALAVFYDMLAEQKLPNYVTFVGVLSACGHLRLVEEGFYYLHHLMYKMGIEPGLEHYTCIVGLLGKAGQLDVAENFMRSAPIKWDVVAWRTLLNACHVHRYYGLGMRVAEVLLQLNPDDVSTCILLSNMHAKASSWDGASRMRKLMKGRNIKKEPGLSWTEIGNTTHVFVSDDNKHAESVQIHKKIRDLLSEIKPLGYVPDVASALHDVEEEQIEGSLTYHSEKLATAYALMKTPPSAPIRVIKNLRICDDCHSAVKLISKVTNRLIIIRDVNRFHSFRDGHCSCADYW